jgi:23S rRNA pseudouridine2605 synthase
VNQSRRLHVVMAQSGVGSRRTCEALIADGQVHVNGEMVEQQGMLVNPFKDAITVSGKPLPPPPTVPAVLLYYKPRGVVTTMSDPEGRPSVGDLIARLDRRLFPVGRLDRDSEGLMILTDHGELARRLGHPSFGVARTYLVTVSGRPSAATLRAIASGVKLPDFHTAPTEVVMVQQGADRARLYLTLTEGRNREIRRLFEHFGHEVLKLRRTTIGPLEDPTMVPGSYRPLSIAETRALFSAVDLKPGQLSETQATVRLRLIAPGHLAKPIGSRPRSLLPAGARRRPPTGAPAVFTRPTSPPKADHHA